jgi:acetyl-CoA carboxylase carboxyl transferase subunit alpha
VIIGEGGSGGAVALAVADRVLMLEYAVYSVISPEGCAAILWRSGDQAPSAAEAMRLTAQDLRQLGVVDQIITGPVGGAHRNPAMAIEAVGDALEAALEPLLGLDGAVLRHRRREKFLGMGHNGAL